MKILIAEDERMMLKTLAFKLAKDGYEVITAENGMKASELIVKELPDILVTDIMMPYVTGLELIRVAKDITTKNIKVLLLSSVGHERTVTQAFELGADDFMTKPFSPNELTMRIKRLLTN